jgi:hypothetical protein
MAIRRRLRRRNSSRRNTSRKRSLKTLQMKYCKNICQRYISEKYAMAPPDFI